MKHFLIALLLPFILVPALLAQTGQLSDKIIAVVNDRIILKSEVDREVSDYLRQMQMNNQPVEFSEELWYQVLESIIDNYVLLEKAELDSIVVSDEIVDQQMDRRIQQMIQQAGSEQALEQAFGQSIVQMKAEFREQFREQLITQQVREQKMLEVNITRPEVREFFEGIPSDSLPIIPEQVALSQIVKIPPPLEDAKQEAFQKAQQIRDSIVVHDKPFEEMARKYSSGPSAANGGLLPMMQMSDLVPEYSAAAAALEPGEVSSVVETVFGFHIIRLNQRVGDNIETNNLLISVDEESLDEDRAINELNAIRDSVLHHGAVFNEIARRHSDDEFTAGMGGRLLNRDTGERLFALNQLEPSLYRTVLLLDDVGQISEPRPFNPQNQSAERAFRIVRLDRHIPEHRASLEQDYERIKNIALQRKQMQVLTDWLQDLRDEVYIEYKIDVPDHLKEPNPDLHELHQAPADTR